MSYKSKDYVVKCFTITTQNNDFLKLFAKSHGLKKSYLINKLLNNYKKMYFTKNMVDI